MNKKVVLLAVFLGITAMIVAVTVYPLENFDENTYHYWTSYNNGILPSSITGGVAGPHGYWSASVHWSMGDWIPDSSVGLWYNMQGDPNGDQGTTTPFTLTNMTPNQILLPPDYTSSFTYPYALTNAADPYRYYKLLQVDFSQGYWGNFWNSGHTSWYCGDVSGGYLITNNTVDMTYPAHLSLSVLKLPGGGGSGYLYVDYSATNSPTGPWTNLIDGHQIQHSSGTWVSYIEDLPAITLPDGSHNVYLLLRFRGNVTTGWANAPFQQQPNYWMDDFEIYNDEPPLPVELSSFTVVTSVTNQAMLTWVTQSETGVAGFNIYRGNSNVLADAEMLNVFIEATNTSQQQSYIYVDEEIWESGTYYYWLESRDLDGANSFYGPVTFNLHPNDQQTPPVNLVTGIDGVYPNPFNPTATVSYTVSETAEVQIQIFNTKGQLVRDLMHQTRQPGTYRALWDGKDDNGRSCTSGLYNVVLRAGKDSFNRKAALLK